MKKKLSTLMKEGAKVLSEGKGQYFDAPLAPVAACAIGCAMYVLGVKYSEYIPQHYKDILSMPLEVEKLPSDIQAVLNATKYIEYSDDNKIAIHDIIVDTNDNISRERAIQLVREMGY